MKIDPADKSQPFYRPAADNVKKHQGPRGFDAVLQQTLQEPASQKGCTGPSIRSAAGPQASMGFAPRLVQTAESQAHKLIDRLENYQQLLGDPDMTLKVIQPTVDQMARQAETTRASIADMPADHPLRPIVQNAIATIEQEIERFYSGRYVDD
jgi:hypothetical protein